MNKVKLSLFIGIMSALVLLIYGITNFCTMSTPNSSGQESIVLIINFFAPMQQESLKDKIRITPEIPSAKVSYNSKWLSPFRLKLTLAPSGNPQGQLFTFQIKDVSTVIPGLKKSFKGQVRAEAPLQILSKSRLTNIPSRGPVPITFNSPVNPETIKKNISLPVQGYLKPKSINFRGRRYVDYSNWLFLPGEPFKHNSKYTIKLSPGLKNIGGSVLGKNRQISFTIAKRPKVIGTKPAENAKGVQLYQKIEFTHDQKITAAFVQVSESNGKRLISGETMVKGEKVIFLPAKAFLPGETYHARLVAESQAYEPLVYQLTFTTVDIGEKLWVEVNLGELHMMTVYQGSQKIRQMLASGGRPESPTPTGVFYSQDRGYSFFSPRFGEGATYWVRLVGQILVHSVPRDSRWKVKEEEHAKLGLPASHGCVRLQERDAKWFYENIPGGTMVIIFNSTGGESYKQSFWFSNNNEHFSSSLYRKDD